MSLNIWNREDVENTLRSVAIARKPLTDDDVQLLEAIAAAFGVSIDFKRFRQAVRDRGLER